MLYFISPLGKNIVSNQQSIERENYMENHKDIENISKQLNKLKRNIDASKEQLSAMEMLMVDNNNGRLKDKTFANDFQQLNSSFESLMNSVKTLEKKLDH